MKIKNQYSNKLIIIFLRRQLSQNRPDQQSADNMLDPFACGLHADVSLFCFFVFYTKRKMFESLNVIKEMVACSVQPSSYGYTSEVFLALKKLNSGRTHGL